MEGKCHTAHEQVQNFKLKEFRNDVHRLGSGKVEKLGTVRGNNSYMALVHKTGAQGEHTGMGLNEFESDRE